MFSTQRFCGFEIQHTGAIYRDRDNLNTEAGFEVVAMEQYSRGVQSLRLE